MLRFCGKKQAESDCLEPFILEERVLMDDNFWQNQREYFRRTKMEAHRPSVIALLPVVDDRLDIVCYGWQDDEANRELRMLKELEKSATALQFRDIFPEVREVLICGCNELAYYFAKYLERQQVKVSVAGRYWDFFGYKSTGDIDPDDGEKMVIQAERMLGRTGDLYQRLIRSASPEFECIDVIYEANVKDERIKNTERGGVEWLLKRLKGKDVFLAGNSAREQDAYDWLYAHGVDISGFIFGGEGWYGASYFLGKKRVGISEVMDRGERAAVINCADENGALGMGTGEEYDYYCGYERNEQYFMLRDYVDVPVSNLVHVLKGKAVLLVGDEGFCRILADYLEGIEQGEIDVRCGGLPESRKMKETDVICAVYPNDLSRDFGKKGKAFCDAVSGMGDARITWYFSDSSTFVAVDRYRNRVSQKYSLSQLKPKGILLGSIAFFAGNVFVEGIMDGHPDIIAPLQGLFVDQLLYYSILLAEEKPEDILDGLKNIFENEYGQSEISDCFPHFDIFKSSAEKWLSQKEGFSSQELFMIFVVAYTEMLTGEKITDLSAKVVYWEPHIYDRAKFCYLAEWLESEGINGQTMILRRDNIARCASCYNYIRREESALQAELSLVFYMYREDYIKASHEVLLGKHWQIFAMRFEDIKLHPREELSKICDRMEIPWSDTMLHTTSGGKPHSFLGSRDFTLRPVFDRREKYFSLFDQFRISVINAPYQKKYGYPYVDCREFSRAGLWEMFLEEFRFQQGGQFATSRERADHYLRTYEALRCQLWAVRKHAVLDDIIPQFGPVEIDKPLEAAQKDAVKKKTAADTKRENLGKLLSLVRQQEKLILYGTGRDCDGLLSFLTEPERDRLLYCDRKAAHGTYTYRGKKVLAPSELCGEYMEYMILITSSMYATSIQWELEDMGIAPERIVRNNECLWWI